MLALVTHGLRAKIMGIQLMDGPPGSRLLAALIEASDDQLARPHHMRPFELHVSIAYENQLDWWAEDAIRGLNARWTGAHHTFKVWWVGGGATAQLHPDDPFVRDPNFAVLFKRKHPHISM